MSLLNVQVSVSATPLNLIPYSKKFLSKSIQVTILGLSVPMVLASQLCFACLLASWNRTPVPLSAAIHSV